MMNPKTIVLIIVAVVWLAVEAYLILRDAAHRKGKTNIDRKTRNYNIASTELALILAPIIAWIPFFQFATISTSIVFWTGIVILCLGFFLRQWAVYLLGTCFRTTVELEKEQKVIQKGPYKYIRHPSYSGIILFFIGYGLVTENWLSLLMASALPTIALIHRIKVEENALVQGMGAEYEAYQKRTKKLIPGIW
jgi:protein-S-isoprenylcysteine O-methyltransferase Ste14